MTQDKKVCQSALATRALLYSDTLGGKQTMRDDLWAVTTAELNALEAFITTAKAIQKQSPSLWTAYERQISTENKGE